MARENPPRFNSLCSPTWRHDFCFCSDATKLIFVMFVLTCHHSRHMLQALENAIAMGEAPAPAAADRHWQPCPAPAGPHRVRHIEDATDVERCVRPVVQGVAGLVVGLSDVAVELLVLPLAHILGVHHPNSLEREIHEDVVSKMCPPNNHAELGHWSLWPWAQASAPPG